LGEATDAFAVQRFNAQGESELVPLAEAIPATSRQAAVTRMLSSLSEEQRGIVAKRYGSADVDPLEVIQYLSTTYGVTPF
jgi:hypothetical protein